MKEFKVYITQNYKPITTTAETQEEAESLVEVRFKRSGHMWEELQVKELNVLAVGIADTHPKNKIKRNPLTRLLMKRRSV